MSFFKNLAKLFTPQVGGGNEYSYWINVKCNRCGEVIRARVDLRNDLSPEYTVGDMPSSYYCRKVLVGEQKCFQPIEVVLKFDGKRKVIDQAVTGGKIVEEE